MLIVMIFNLIFYICTAIGWFDFDNLLVHIFLILYFNFNFLMDGRVTSSRYYLIFPVSVNF